METVARCTAAVRKTRFGPLLRTAAVFCFYFVLNVTFQYWAGAVGAGFGGYPDESTHYVSSLLVHDYVRSGFPGPPLHYAVDYYAHLPSLAIGYWPPVFYGLAASWIFVLGASRVSVLAFVAAFSAITSTVLQRHVRASCGGFTSLAAGALFAVLPVVRWHNTMFLVDVAVAFFGFMAAVACGNYLTRGERRHAILYGIWASCCVLTKANGVFALALLPLGIVLTRRFVFLRRINTWLAFALIAAFWGTWLLATYPLMTIGLPPRTSGLIQNLSAIPGLCWFVLRQTGWPLLALFGWAYSFVRPTSPTRLMFALVPPLVAGILAFAPVGAEGRYTIPAIPALIVLMAAGLHRLAGWAGFWTWPVPRKAGTLMLACVVLTVLFQPPPRVASQPRGLTDVARAVLADAHLRDDIVVVSSHTDSGGAAIAEFASRESRRPKTYVLRANKVLAQESWNSDRYRVRYSTDAEVAQALADDCVGVLIVSAAPPGARVREHHRLLVQMLEAYRDRWQLVGAYPAGSPNYLVYHSAGHCRSESSRLPRRIAAELTRKISR